MLLIVDKIIVLSFGLCFCFYSCLLTEIHIIIVGKTRVHTMLINESLVAPCSHDNNNVMMWDENNHFI